MTWRVPRWREEQCGRAKDVKAAYGQTKVCWAPCQGCVGVFVPLRGMLMIWHPQCVCARIRLALCLCSVMHVHGTRCLLEMCGR